MVNLSFMQTLTSFLRLQQVLLRTNVCKCAQFFVIKSNSPNTMVTLQHLTDENKVINHELIQLGSCVQSPSPDVEVSGGPQRECEGGCRGGRLGDGP